MFGVTNQSKNKIKFIYTIHFQQLMMHKVLYKQIQ